MIVYSVHSTHSSSKIEKSFQNRNVHGAVFLSFLLSLLQIDLVFFFLLFSIVFNVTVYKLTPIHIRSDFWKEKVAFGAIDGN